MAASLETQVSSCSKTGVSNSFSPHQPRSCLQRAECNFNSLTVSYIYTVLKLFWPFEGNHEADVAPDENEFDTSALKPCSLITHTKTDCIWKND